MKERPKYWKSIKSGELFLYKDYCNHGCGGIKHGMKDLPKEGYPYTIIYENQ